MIRLSLLFALIISNGDARERCELIELNHFHNHAGEPVFSQVIFWDWDDFQKSHLVRAWRIVEKTDLIFTRVNDDFVCRWRDSQENLHREIASRFFRESWTQVDPERKSRQLNGCAGVPLILRRANREAMIGGQAP